MEFKFKHGQKVFALMDEEYNFFTSIPEYITLTNTKVKKQIITSEGEQFLESRNGKKYSSDLFFETLDELEEKMISDVKKLISDYKKELKDGFTLED